MGSRYPGAPKKVTFLWSPSTRWNPIPNPIPKAQSTALDLEVAASRFFFGPPDIKTPLKVMCFEIDTFSINNVKVV